MRVIMSYASIETLHKLLESTRKNLNFGLHQGSVLSLLLFAVVLDEITKDLREGNLKEFLNADNLELLGDSWSKVEEKYGK